MRFIEEIVHQYIQGKVTAKKKVLTEKCSFKNCDCKKKIEATSKGDNT